VDKALQHRLVGAGVILALGVIIIPIVLDSAGERQLRKMPPEPTIVSPSRPGFIKKQPIARPVNPEAGQIIISLPEDKKTAPVVEAKEPPAKKQPAPGPEKVTSVTKSSPPPQKPTPPPTKPTNTSSKISSNWVVQVGSFTDQDKGIKLRDTLRKKRYKAFVEQISGRNGQPLYRVRVGPLPTRKQTEKLAGQLKKSGYKGFITLHP